MDTEPPVVDHSYQWLTANVDGLRLMKLYKIIDPEQKKMRKLATKRKSDNFSAGTSMTEFLKESRIQYSMVIDSK